MSRTLAVRLDSDGDVLLTGPALRALAAGADALDLLVSPSGEQAARLLPAVDRVLVFAAPWAGFSPPTVDSSAVNALLARLREGGYGRAVIFTSFHQSPLPMALLARLAGVGWIAATSEDYPGSLLDLRHCREDGHEVQAALGLARACGAQLPPGDDARLALRRPLPDVSDVVPSTRYVVVHPGAAVGSRAIGSDHARDIVGSLAANAWPVVVTGGPGERSLTAHVAGGVARDLGGRTSLAELAAVLERASCVVVGNTGPAHLAAAVGTPVVSLFAPVVPAARWAPWGVPVVLLGDQRAPCRDSRARDCPIPGHPCLTGVPPAEVLTAVRQLTDGAAGRTAAGRRLSVATGGAR